MWQLPRIATEDIIMYLRKSRTDDPTLTVEEVLSKHEQMLDEWVERNLPDCGGRIPEENRFREIVSGETIESRPAVKEVLHRVEMPKYKALLIVEPQRLSRGDLEDIGRLVKILRYSTTIVITMQYTYDLTDERDRDAFERELKRGNEFLEYQKRIMNNGRLLSVENGNFVGNTAPYGYKKVQVREGKKVCHTLEIVPEEAEIVKLVFDWYLKGDGCIRIGNKLAELGIPAPAGGQWGRSSVRNILDNVHYLGKIRWNYRKTVKTIKDGDVVKSRPKAEDFLIFPGKHPAIIDQETFDAVKKKTGSLPRVKNKRPLINPLAGLLYCECGAVIAYRQYIKHGIKTSEPRYVCNMSSRCKSGSCLASELLDYVKEVLAHAIEDIESHVKAGEDNSLQVHRKAVERLEKRLAELEALETAQWEKYTLEGMPKAVFDRLNGKVLAEKQEVERALCTAKDAMPEPVDFEERLMTFRTAVEMMSDPEAEVEVLNGVLKECIERITYSRERKEKGFSYNEEPFQVDIKLRIPPQE